MKQLNKKVEKQKKCAQYFHNFVLNKLKKMYEKLKKICEKLIKNRQKKRENENETNQQKS